MPERRLIFAGRMAVSPVLFMGAVGYFVYLADRDRFRSVVLSELSRIMTFADLDNTYYIDDWFATRKRLVIQVAKRGQRNRGRFDVPYKNAVLAGTKNLRTTLDRWWAQAFHFLQ